jgi:hypothetical protein
LFPWVQRGQSTLFNKVKFVNVISCAHNIGNVQCFAFLLLGNLCANTSQVLYEQFRCLGDENECLLANEIVVLCVKLAYLPDPVHGQLHKLPYRVKLVRLVLLLICSSSP